MRIFLTGATGFVGGAVLDALLDARHEVVALVHDAEKAEAVRCPRCDPLVGDMTEPEGWVGAAAGCEAIVHAAQRSMGFPITQEAVDATTDADRRALDGFEEAVRTGGVDRIVYTSGLWSYGDHGDDWIDESVPFRPQGIDLKRVEREATLAEWSRTGFAHTCSLVLGNVYGRGGSFEGYVERARQGEHNVIESGQSFMSPVHRRDVGIAYVRALELAPSGERYNVCDDEPIRAIRHAELLCAAAGGPPPGNASFDDVAAAIGPLHARSLTQSIRMSNARFRSQLGWQPRFSTFEEGVAEALRAP